MSDTPAVPRLRDERADGDPRDPVVARAGELIRAVAPPPPLDPRADARVLAALGGNGDHGGWASWRLPLQRVLVLAAAVIALAATGAGAAAAIDWIRAVRVERPEPPLAPPPPAPVEPPRKPAARPAPPAAVAHPPTMVVETHSPVPAGTGFAKARRAIDPDARAYRPLVAPEFAKTHAGERFAWRVSVCISAAGEVISATTSDHVHPQLDGPILRAIERWKYIPAYQDGRPIRSCLLLAYRLTLGGAGL
jgi:hypothetical protein